MPLQNRVDPWGQLNAVPTRGSLMGNRGILHNGSRQIVRPWARKSWVACALEFNEIRRKVFGEGTYSELFFLDEATAFAAGHRPCNYCRKPRFREFKAAWLRANRPDSGIRDTLISEIDKALHAERAIAGGGRVRFGAALNDLPPGALFEHEGAAFLIRIGAVHRWSFEVYTLSSPKVGFQALNVLTPASIVSTYEQGFAPCVRASAGS